MWTDLVIMQLIAFQNCCVHAMSISKENLALHLDLLKTDVRCDSPCSGNDYYNTSHICGGRKLRFNSPWGQRDRFAEQVQWRIQDFPEGGA